MSIKLMNLVWQSSLHRSNKLLLLALADSANDEGVTWPSIKNLMAKCSLTERQICYSIKELIILGVISKEARVRNNGSQSSNCYFINESILYRFCNKNSQSEQGYSEHIAPPPLKYIQGDSEHIAPHIITNRTNNSSEEELYIHQNDFLLTKFEEFWNLYPNKKAKDYCKKWFLKNCSKKIDLPDKIIEGVKKYLPYWETREEFIPHPHTWLNRGRWEDEIKESEIDVF